MSALKNFAKTAALECFRNLTLPYRWMEERKAHADNNMPSMVLYYHRVADTHPVAWSLTNEQFKAHINWLEDNFELVTLAEVQRRMRDGSDTPSIHITFDDGCAENCQRALPLLIERSIPCTYFVTLDNVANNKPFVHDENIGGEFPVNTVEELKELSKNGIEIGAHTRHHPSMGHVDDLAITYDEIVLARRELEALVDQRIRYFAFPFGLKPNLSHAAAAMAKADGIECVVSAYGGYNFRGDDPFHIQRVHGDPELARIRNALTFDPRHMKREKFELKTKGNAVSTALDFYHSQQPSSKVNATPPAPGVSAPLANTQFAPNQVTQ